jgi:hypothetical protein
MVEHSAGMGNEYIINFDEKLKLKSVGAEFNLGSY